jgi:hypothetical protein
MLSVACLIFGAALTLAACNPENKPNVAAVQTRGATVAFESIDGLPQTQFHTLVQDLNNEARTQRLAVTSRDQSSAYRVRGYLAATVDRGKTTISWVWDVFDRNQQRALRIGGSETAKGGQEAGQGWQAADSAMLQRIAHASMGELAAFLTSPTVAPAAAPAASGPRIAFTTPDITTPESAGIFRIFHPKADPVSTPEPATTAAITAAAAVPLPRRRPPPATALSRGETMTLAAARR